MIMLYPAFIDLSKKECLIVGGGPVATKRVESLLPYGASIRVISPEATERIQELGLAGEIIWVPEEYAAHQLSGAFLVVAATNSPEVNGQVVEAAESQNMLVCRADDGMGGNYITAAAVNRGALQIAITTSGTSPTLAAVVKSRIDRIFGPEWNMWSSLFTALRPSLKLVKTEAARRSVVDEIIGNEAIAAFIAADRLIEAEKAANQCILSHSA